MATTPIDPDRAVILLRRRRFALLALGGLGVVDGGCHREPQPEPVEVPTQAPSEDRVVSTTPDSGPNLSAAEKLRAMRLAKQEEQALAEQAAALDAEAMQAHERGDHARAVELFVQSVELAPNRWEAHYSLGLEAFEVGDCDLAYSSLRQFLLFYEGTDNALMTETFRLLAQMEETKCVSPDLLPPSPCLSIGAPRTP